MKRSRDGTIRRSPLSYCPVLLPTTPRSDRSPSPKAIVFASERQNSPSVAARTGAFDVASTIRTFKLFETAPEELIELIINRMRSRVVEKGDEICREGEDAKGMYWIIRGSASVVSRDGESKYAELQSGQFFG